MKVKENFRKFQKNYEFYLKKIGKRMRKILVNFTLNLGKVCRKPTELQD